MKATLLRTLFLLAALAGVLLFAETIQRDRAILAARAERLDKRREDHPARPMRDARERPRNPLPRSVRRDSDEEWEAYRSRYLALRERRERRSQSRDEPQGRPHDRRARSPR